MNDGLFSLVLRGRFAELRSSFDECFSGAIVSSPVMGATKRVS